MTDQLFNPTEHSGKEVGAGPASGSTVSLVPAPLEPTGRVGRWVLHRAGIVNVWQYDRAEVHFAGGRALVRGKNGAGKSKLLEVLLPFLLDGDTRGIDAAGRDRTTVYWLMTDGRDAGNHVGYLWLELRMTGEDGEERFCTLGAGLKASTATRQHATWFFLTEDARVGADLDLGPQVSLEKLKERLGADAVTTATEHRRRVATNLFGLQDEARYANLLYLLRRLRDPNIGNRIEAGELATVLRDALPPPSDGALEKAADRFDTLDQVRDQLRGTERTSAALGRFLQIYASYARGVLRERAQSVLTADGSRRRAQREARRLRDGSEAAAAAKREADAEVDRLDGAERKARADLEGLQDSEAYKEHLHLDDRRRAVAARLQAAAVARDGADRAADMAGEAAEDERRASGHAEAAGRRVEEARPALVRLAREAGLDQAVVPRQAEGIAAASAAATGRRRVAAHVEELAGRAERAAGLAEQADARAARSEQDQAERQASAEEADAQWAGTSRAWREAVLAWTRTCLPGPGSPGEGADEELEPLEALMEPPDWERLHRVMAEGGAEAEELAAVPEAVRAVLAPLRDTAWRAEAAARADLGEAERSWQEAEAERELLEAEEEARPPASRFLTAVRDERAGAPFYELVDVAPGVDDGARAGLEAALEASGLLDAWVARDGLIVHPSTHDVIVRPGAPPLPAGTPTLADVLTAARPEAARVLQAVGLGDPGSGGPGTGGPGTGDRGDHPWVATDGRWSLGPVRGAWSKPQSEYLGAGTRRATRERRLAEVRRRLSELAAAVERAGARVEAAVRRREQLDEVPATMPTDAEVRGAASTARALAGVAAAAQARAEEDRRGAEQARTAAALARHELNHAAGLESLPVTVDALAAVGRAAAELTRELRRWEGTWSEWDGRRREATEAGARRQQRDEAAGRAATTAEALEQQHRDEADALLALEQAVGASVAKVLDAITACREALESAARSLPGARKWATEQAEAAGRAEALAAAALEAVDTATAAVTVAGERLARAAVLPGVGTAACGTEWEWEGGDAVTEGATDAVAMARHALSGTGSGEGAEASDQVVLNRSHELEEGLAGGYDVVFGEEDGVKYFFVVDDSGSQPLPMVAERVAAEAEAARRRLLADEREVIERFLLGELGEELRERLLESHDLVRAANRALAGVRTSHGKGVHLSWQVDPDASSAVRAATELLVMAPRAEEEDTRLRDALMELIQAQRERDPSLGYLSYLRGALDYRHWYRFTVQAVDDARPGSARILSPRLGLSQGEQRVLSYLALFAAAAAHFDGLGTSCPRLLLLDDAFAKVDEPTHGRLLQLLVELDLDFMLTSERMWGCFPEVPSLEIYEALREPLVPGVALVHFRWDGRQRHLVGM